MVILNEGGAVGHLAHLYDNRDLTFGEMKGLLRAAATGKLKKVSEKLDGLNIVVSWDVNTNDLRAARNSGDIKSGGMNAEAIASKFFGRGNLEEAFTTAFKVLKDAISALSSRTKVSVFGESANKWYSAEIIYTKNPNVINYDSNHVVFHGWPVFEVDASGSVSRSSDDSGVGILQTNVEKMQRAVTVRNWRVKGPALLQLKSLTDGTALSDVVSRIDSAMSSASVSDSNTVGEYLRSMLEDDVIATFNFDKGVVDSIVMRCLGEDGAPTLNDIKKIVPKNTLQEVSNFVKTSGSLIKRYIAPIEDAVNDFALQVLNGLHSTLINDSDAEVARLRNEVTKAINAISSSGQDAAMEILNRQLQKLGSVENISTAMEGVVFIYKGNAYKLTGGFAQINQILGLFKYGRSGIKI